MGVNGHNQSVSKTYIANVDADVFCSDFIIEDEIDKTGEVRVWGHLVLASHSLGRTTLKDGHKQGNTALIQKGIYWYTYKKSHPFKTIWKIVQSVVCYKVWGWEYVFIIVCKYYPSPIYCVSRTIVSPSLYIWPVQITQSYAANIVDCLTLHDLVMKT